MRGRMSEGLVWGIVFVLSALTGIGGLILLHRSALSEALARATADGLVETEALHEKLTKAADVAAKDLREAGERLAAADAAAKAKQRELEAQSEALASQIGTLHKDLRAKANALDATTYELRAKDRELAPYLAIESGLRGRLKRMEAVWLDTQADEPACHRLLERNLWVLYPDYVVDGQFLSNRGVSSAFENHFGQKREDWVGGKEPLDQQSWRIRVGASSRPDLFGNASTAASPGEPDDVYLIIELKAPGLTLTWDHIEQVHAYALSLMMNVGGELRNRRVDCLVIGKDWSEDVNDAHLRWGKEAHHAIRIIPMTYEQLYKRAQLIVALCLDRAFIHAEAAVPPIEQLGSEAESPDAEAAFPPVAQVEVGAEVAAA